MLTCPPTVLSPFCSVLLTAVMAAFSMSATIAGVASTGMSPDPICSAELSLLTMRVLVCCSPISMFGYMLLVNCKEEGSTPSSLLVPRVGLEPTQSFLTKGF